MRKLNIEPSLLSLSLSSLSFLFLFIPVQAAVRFKGGPIWRKSTSLLSSLSLLSLFPLSIHTRSGGHTRERGPIWRKSRSLLSSLSLSSLSFLFLLIPVQAAVHAKGAHLDKKYITSSHSLIPCLTRVSLTSDISLSLSIRFPGLQSPSPF